MTARGRGGRERVSSETEGDLAVRERIARSTAALTKSEKRAAQVLLSDYPMLGLESITRFAERAGTSVATIQRFALKLGFDSYPAFRTQLRGELAEAHQGPLTMARWYEAPDAPTRTLRASLIEAIEATLVPLAERSGLIVPIGRWVLDTACRQMAEWLEEGLSLERVAVNISVRQFLAPDFVELVADTLRRHRLEPSRLELEITESLLMKDVERAIVTLGALKALGVELAIDDFGTGYSSLGYLKRFPIDRLKIDRIFVRDILSNSDDAAITRAVIAMAHSMKLGVVAEGVETEEQLRFLAHIDCEEVQGYHLSRPLPAIEVGPFVRAAARACVAA